MVEKDHLSSSDDDKKFEKLNKLAGKYKKEEVFTKFKSPFLGNVNASSEDEEDNEEFK